MFCHMLVNIVILILTYFKFWRIYCTFYFVIISKLLNTYWVSIYNTDAWSCVLQTYVLRQIRYRLNTNILVIKYRDILLPCFLLINRFSNLQILSWTINFLAILELLIKLSKTSKYNLFEDLSLSFFCNWILLISFNEIGYIRY